MFYVDDYSSKVIPLATSEGSFTTFVPRYGSYDRIWKDNQEKGTRENNTTTVVS
jgi:hypothetical protein